ncbi:MAG: hypothetical protein AAF483_01670 [Planctomycetota bacterium]
MNHSPIQIQDLNPQRDDYAKLLVDRVFQYAIEMNASDIHLTQSPHGTQIRVRFFGELRELGTYLDSKQLIVEQPPITGALKKALDVEQTTLHSCHAGIGGVYAARA